jgi:hypothetical protein
VLWRTKNGIEGPDIFSRNNGCCQLIFCRVERNCSWRAKCIFSTWWRWSVSFCIAQPMRTCGRLFLHVLGLLGWHLRRTRDVMCSLMLWKIVCSILLGLRTPCSEWTNVDSKAEEIFCFYETILWADACMMLLESSKQELQQSMSWLVMTLWQVDLTLDCWRTV